tara:strand:- start:5425 stop:5928 length:504 start_codon:yes stop_codon:yes gene_type:complete
MADPYTLGLTASQINDTLIAAQNSDNAPAAGQSNLVNSNRIYEAIQDVTSYVDSSSITTTTGTAPYYGCRAFASYNGATQVLNNGANISSVTRNSVGNYTFNFNVAMPDANYSIVVGGTFSGQTNNAYISAFQTFNKTTSSFQIKTTGSGPSGGLIDQTVVDVAIFR